MAKVKTASGYAEENHYRSATPFGLDETWTWVDHPGTPEGWRLQRRTTYALICAKCGRTTIGLQPWTELGDAIKDGCYYCG